MNFMIADDHFIVRIGLKYELSSNPEYTLIGEASNGFELLEKIKMQQPDIVVVDMHMPVMGGVEVIKELKQNYPQILIIVLSQFKDIQKVSEAVVLGADAYLLKDGIREELLFAIKEVISGRLFLSSDLPDYNELIQKYEKMRNLNSPWISLFESEHKNTELDFSDKIQKLTEFQMLLTEKLSGKFVSKDSSERVILEKLKQLFNEKFYIDSSINLTKTAQLMEIPPGRLSMLVKDNIHLTFPQLLNYFRVTEAMSLIMENNISKSIEIAFASGFGTKSQYNSLFREITSLSPIEFRKEYFKKS